MLNHAGVRDVYLGVECLADRGTHGLEPQDPPDEGELGFGPNPLHQLHRAVGQGLDGALHDIRRRGAHREMIDDLELIMNTARQSAITQELSEIIGGAAAV